jgi:hypothetical protein
MPALLTSVVSEPNCDRRRHRRGPAGHVGHVQPHERRPAARHADPRRHLGPQRLLQIPDHHRRALTGEQLGLRRTQTAGTPGNQRDLAGHPLCHPSLS